MAGAAGIGGINGPDAIGGSPYLTGYRNAVAPNADTNAAGSGAKTAASGSKPGVDQERLMRHRSIERKRGAERRRQDLAKAQMYQIGPAVPLIVYPAGSLGVAGPIGAAAGAAALGAAAATELDKTKEKEAADKAAADKAAADKAAADKAAADKAAAAGQIRNPEQATQVTQQTAQQIQQDNGPGILSQTASAIGDGAGLLWDGVEGVGTLAYDGVSAVGNGLWDVGAAVGTGLWDVGGAVGDVALAVPEAALTGVVGTVASTLTLPAIGLEAAAYFGADSLNPMAGIPIVEAGASALGSAVVSATPTVVAAAQGLAAAGPGLAQLGPDMVNLTNALNAAHGA
jgi:hypothetical protein